MSSSIRRKTLPAEPSLEHLQKQAKQRVKAAPGLQLAVAQHQLAQEYGHDNWASLADLVRIMSDPARKEVNARFQGAQRLAAENQPAQALEEYLWCFDVGMKRVPSMSGVRVSFLLMYLKRLGKTHPPARQALIDRREQARGVLSVAAATTAWTDFVSLNWVLDEADESLTHYDRLKFAGQPLPPPKVLFENFLKAKRYEEAALARPFQRWSDDLDHDLKFMRAWPAEEQIVHQRYMVNSAGQVLEALAGSGDLVHAREIVERIRSITWTADVVETMRGHAVRAGHPELIPGA